MSDHERKRAQKLLITLEMEAGNLRPAAKHDDIARTVNYFAVAERVKEWVAQKPPRKLLETLAEDLAAELLEAFPIQNITVEIKKFIFPDTRWVSVQITRKKR
ncbi:MAG TPA: dihydroneopterin aldolase [Candidatus Methylacidiphilales bacterium]|nr:dihydroneopterin aldolase [Candidatus Methylacidiphilales bacterium]